MGQAGGYDAIQNAERRSQHGMKPYWMHEVKNCNAVNRSCLVIFHHVRELIEC